MCFYGVFVVEIECCIYTVTLASGIQVVSH